MTRKAEPGLRIRHRHDHDREGVIRKVRGHIAWVDWDDGTSTQIPTSSIYEAGGKTRWPLIAALVVMSLGLLIAIIVWE